MNPSGCHGEEEEANKQTNKQTLHRQLLLTYDGAHRHRVERSPCACETEEHRVKAWQPSETTLVSTVTTTKRTQLLGEQITQSASEAPFFSLRQNYNFAIMPGSRQPARRYREAKYRGNKAAGFANILNMHLRNNLFFSGQKQKQVQQRSIRLGFISRNKSKQKNTFRHTVEKLLQCLMNSSQLLRL